MARNDGSNSVAIVAIVVIILFVAIVAFYFFNHNGIPTAQDTPSTTKIEAPKTTIEMPKSNPSNDNTSTGTTGVKK